MYQSDVARSVNYIFTLGEDRQISYHVQSANITDVTMNETPFAAGPKDLFLPSNKIDTSPLTVQILLSDDLNEWVECYKWMLQCKNSKASSIPDLVKSCELTALDSQNQERVRFIYTDTFPINVSSVQYSSQGESIALTFDLTLRFNQFKVVKDGQTIDESYTGE